MSRLFDALQNAGNNITEKLDTQDDPPEIVSVTDRPRRSTKKGDSRFFALLKTLRLLKPRRDGCLVALMGPRGGEGTSTVAKDLADFISRQTGGQTLLLECRPNAVTRVSEIRRFARDKTLATLHTAVAASAHTSTLCSSYASATMLSDDGDRTEPRDSRDVASFFDLIATEYDWVIMDCPPVLQLNYNNRLAQLADAAILVVESERSEVNDVIQASNQLKLIDTNVLGVVLNKRPNYVPTFLRRLMNRFGID